MQSGGVCTDEVGDAKHRATRPVSVAYERVWGRAPFSLERSEHMKSKLFNTALIILAFGATVLAIVGGAHFRAGLDVTEGMYSSERIRAPYAFENVHATERNRMAAQEFAENLPPRYKINPAEWPFVANHLSLLRTDLEDIRTAYNQELEAHNRALSEWEAEILLINEQAHRAQAEWIALQGAMLAAGAYPSDIPAPPVPPEPPSMPEFMGATFDMFATLQMPFFDSDQVLTIVLSEYAFDTLWYAVGNVAENVQTTLQITEVTFLTQLAVQNLINTQTGLDRATEELVERIVLHHLRSNVIPDEELNQQEYDRVRFNYEQVLVREGQILVDEGEIITADIYRMLGELGMLRSDSVRDSFVPLLGVMVLVAILFLMSITYLSFYRPTIAANKKEAMLLFTIFILSLSLVWTIREFSIPLLPLLMFPMLVSLLIDRRCALLLTFSMMFICFFVVEGSLAYLLFYIPAGLLICLLSRFTIERNKVFLVSLMVTALQFVLAISVELIVERNHALNDIQGLLINAIIVAASGMLTVIICTGSLPFWETFFGVVTPVKLLDLTNPTNLLLRRLTIEAPGTYHHSLIVANLAETAAFDIGANAPAARVGGYYHDVGKLKSPHYFAENLDGDNPHDHMEPIASAQLLISHVTYGLTLASEHRLPQFVRDIIKEHHGTTLLQYFYAKAKEIDPQVDVTSYRYPFVIPQTKESACVMLADSVEAAVRATIPNSDSLDEVSKTIRNIVRGKLNDGQLADSQLSIRDVTMIEQSFFRVLKGMYHERIVYPKVEEESRV